VSGCRDQVSVPNITSTRDKVHYEFPPGWGETAETDPRHLKPET